MSLPRELYMEFSLNTWKHFLLPANNCWLAGLHVHEQGLRSLVDLTVATSTDER